MRQLASAEGIDAKLIEVWLRWYDHVQRKTPLHEKSSKIASRCEEKNRKTDRNMEGQCKERQVGAADGGRRERLDQVVTTRTYQANPVREKNSASFIQINI